MNCLIIILQNSSSYAIYFIKIAQLYKSKLELDY